MQKKYIVICIIALIATGLAMYFLFGGKPSSSPSQQNSSPVNANTESAVNTTKAFSIQEIALHASATDCWTIVNGKVYNITSYVPRHPGGDDILRACGTDGTSLFTQRRTDSGQRVGSGTPHSDTAADQLARLQIGVVAN